MAQRGFCACLCQAAQGYLEIPILLFNMKINSRDKDVALFAKRLLSVYEALSSVPSTA